MNKVLQFQCDKNKPPRYSCNECHLFSDRLLKQLIYTRLENGTTRLAWILWKLKIYMTPPCLCSRVTDPWNLDVIMCLKDSRTCKVNSSLCWSKVRVNWKMSTGIFCGVYCCLLMETMSVVNYWFSTNNRTKSPATLTVKSCLEKLWNCLSKFNGSCESRSVCLPIYKENKLFDLGGKKSRQQGLQLVH